MSARCPLCRSHIALSELHARFVCRHCGSRLISETRNAVLACLAILALYGLSYLLLPTTTLAAELGAPLWATLLIFSSGLVVWLEIRVFRALVKIHLRTRPKRRHPHSLHPRSSLKRPKH